MTIYAGLDVSEKWGIFNCHNWGRLLCHRHRIHRIVTLKQAGLTLSQIERLAKTGAVNFGGLVDAQLAALTDQAQQIVHRIRKG